MKPKKNSTSPNILAAKGNKLQLFTFKSQRQTPPSNILKSTWQLKTKSSLGARIAKVLKRKCRKEKASQCNLTQNTKSLSNLPTVTSSLTYQKKTQKKITPSLVTPPKQKGLNPKRNIFKKHSIQEFSSEMNDNTSKIIYAKPKTSTSIQMKNKICNFTKRRKHISEAAIVVSPQNSEKKNIKITSPELLSPIRFLGPKKSIIKSTAMPKLITPTPKNTSTETITHSNLIKPVTKLNFIRNKFGKYPIAEPLIDNSPKDEQPQINHRIFSVKSSPSRTLQLKIDAHNTKMLERLAKIQISKPVSHRYIDSKMPERDKKDLRNTAIQTLIIPERKMAVEKKSLKNKKSQTNICTVRTNIVSPFQNKTLPTIKMYTRTSSARHMQPLDLKTQAQRDKILQSLNEVQLPLPEENWTSNNFQMGSIKLELLKESQLRNLKGKSTNEISNKDKMSPKKRKILTGKYSNKNSNLLTTKIYSEKDKFDRLLPNEKSSGRKHKIKQLFVSGFQFPKNKTGFKEKFTMTSNDLSSTKKTKLTMTTDDLSSSNEPTDKAVTENRQKLTTMRGDSDKNKVNKVTLPTVKRKKPGVQVGCKSHDTELKGIVTTALASRDLPSAECKITLDELFRSPETTLTHEKFNLKGAVSTLVPVENLSLIEKEHVLRTETELGIPLEGRTMSEKILLAKMNAESKAASDAFAEEVKKIKAAGLLRHIKCETSEGKEKVIKELIRQGLPLLEAKTSSEKKIISNVRAELCKLPAGSDTINRADLAKSLIPFLNL